MASNLLILPRELRNAIYEFYFASFEDRGTLHLLKDTTHDPDIRCPLDLLLVNNAIYHEASEVFLRYTTIHIFFPDSDLASFTNRWRHVCPSKNIHSAIVEWRPWISHRPAYEQHCGGWCFVKHTLRLLASMLSGIEYLEIRLEHGHVYWAYVDIRDALPEFALLREAVIIDENQVRAEAEWSVGEADLRWPVPTTINGRDMARGE
ncbi:hypothetical protein LTR27_009708 [Elasticomyces elasticus]|nr:hypothetical protein LTR27_009708 [Elasticomyces elasticus]